MNFDFTDDQQSIKATAREFLADRFKLERVRQLAEAGEYDDGLWRELSELGWPGIFVDEEHGGQGLGVVELVILMEELGYALAPSPFFSNVAAGLMLQHAGSEDQKERWLPGIASGQSLGSVGFVSNGAALVPDAGSAAVIVIVDGDSAVLLESSAVRADPVKTIDSTRRFARVEPADGESLGGASPGPSREALDAGIDRAATALAGELVGVGQRAMEMAVEYARERQQFGRPIGAYQAISHRCAEMLLEVEGARSVVYYAGWAAENEPATLPLAASMAKAYASDAGWRATASALQVHGGIGFTWEHDLHFFLKRAKTDGHLFGTARQHRDRVAELAGLSQAVPA